MSGPEHYREAERLSRAAADGWGNNMIPEAVSALAAQAQVHATLALAAATIDAAAHPNQSQVDYLSAWWEAGA